MSNKNKLIHLISKALLSLFMLGQVGAYFVKHTEVAEAFERLGFPVYLIYPIAIAKVFGVATIWFLKNKAIVHWAYAGFFFNFVIALSAHLVHQDGDYGGVIVALTLLLVSYFSGKGMVDSLHH